MAQNLEDLVNALFECLTSGHPSAEFYDSLAHSLRTLGAHQPALFISTAHAFLLQHNRLAATDRAFLIHSINTVLEQPDVVRDCDEQQALLIINLATQEMAMTKEGDDAWASAAKEVLVTLAKNNQFVGHVMDHLLAKFPPGHTAPPHKYVTLTFAAIAQHNALAFVTFLSDIFSRTSKLLPHLKHNDEVRSVWAHAICAFCESILEFSSSNSAASTGAERSREGIEDGSENNVHDLDLELNETGEEVNSSGHEGLQYTFTDQLEAIYDVVLNWTSSKDAKCRADALECVGTLCLMIPRERINKDLKRLTSLFLSIYKKSVSLEEQFAITRGLGNFLEACCADDTLPVEHYLDDLFNLLFPHVCVVTEQSLATSVDHESSAASMKDDKEITTSGTQIKVRNEAFRCFNVASRRFADRQVYYLLHKMQSDKDSVKLGSTNLMRHLLNSAGNQMEDKRSLITMGLRPLLLDESLSVRVKMSICQLCVALADHDYVQAECGGQNVIQFLLTNLVLKPEALNIAKKSTLPPTQAELFGLNQLHMQCAQALHTIANTCDSAFRLLWPLLFEYLCVEAYNPAMTDLLKCLRILATKQREAGRELDFVTGFEESNVRLAGPHQVMSRLFTCMNGAPLSSALSTRALEALRVLDLLGVWLAKTAPAVLSEQLPKILSLHEELGTALANTDHTDGSPKKGNLKRTTSADYTSLELKCARSQRWQSHVLDLLLSIVCSVNDGEWRQALAAAQGKQLALYVDAPHDKAFLMRCLGTTLARITNTSFVVEHVLLTFRSINHASQVERVGCAMAVGHTSSSHTDLMLTELENIAKWEHMKKSQAGLFTMIKEAMPYGKPVDAEVINLRATLVLSYGYLVFYCPCDVVVQRLEQTVLPFLRQYIANSGKEAVVREAHLETINLIALSVHPGHLNSDYKFSAGYECFSYIKQYVQEEPAETLTSWIRLLAAKASAALIQLDPPLSDNVAKDLIQVLANYTFPINRERSGLKTLDPLSVYAFVLSPYSPTHPSSSTTTLSATNTRSLPQANFAHLLYTSTSTARLHPSHKELSNLVSDEHPPATRHSGSVAGSATPKKAPRAPTAAAAAAKSKQSALVTGSSRIDDDENSTVMDATVMQYRNALGHLIARRPFVETVAQLIPIFFAYYDSPATNERVRALDSTVLVLHVYSEHAADCTLGRASDYSPLPHLLGRLCPRLADSLSTVRLLAARAIWLSFRLALLHRGHSPQDTDLVDAELFDLEAFSDTYLGCTDGKLDAMKCRQAIIAIGREVEARLPQSQVQLYLSVLFKMLRGATTVNNAESAPSTSAKQNNVCSSAAQLLSIMIADRGELLQVEAEILVTQLLECLASEHSNIQTYTELLNGFSLFSAHQQYVAIDVLLRQPLPYTQSTRDAWQIMARDPAQFNLACDYVLDLAANGPSAGQLSAEKSSLAGRLTTPQQNADTQSVLSDASASSTVTDGTTTTSSTAKPKHPRHYEIIELGAGAAVKVVSPETCAITCALTELVKSGEPDEAVDARIPEFLAALLQLLAAVVDTQYPVVKGATTVATSPVPAPGATSGVKPPKRPPAPTKPIITTELTKQTAAPSSLVQQSIMAMLQRIRADPVTETMNAERAWTSLMHPVYYTQAIAVLCRSLAEHRPRFIAPLVRLMVARLDSSGSVVQARSDVERISAVAVLSPLVVCHTHKETPNEGWALDPELLAAVVNALGKALKDPLLIVRKLAIRGYGLIGTLDTIRPPPSPNSRQELLKYAKSAVNAALVGLDDSRDKQDQLAIEAVDALDSLVAVADNSLLVHILPQLLLKIRPCFEKENPALRAAAFSLFAGLGQRVGDEENYRETLHSNVVSALLHLNDSDESVRQKCAHVLATTCHLLDSEHAVNLVDMEIVEKTTTHGKDGAANTAITEHPPRNYPDFLKDFATILAVSFPDRVNYYALNTANYFKSQSAPIRRNAAMMTGFLLAALSAELRGTLSKDLIFSGLVQLLKDQDEEVKTSTARAISNLHAFA